MIFPLILLLMLSLAGCSQGQEYPKYFINENLKVGEKVIMIVGYEDSDLATTNGWFYPSGMIGTMECYHSDCEKSGKADSVSFGKHGAISYGIDKIKKHRFNEYNFFSPDMYLRRIK